MKILLTLAYLIIAAPLQYQTAAMIWASCEGPSFNICLLQKGSNL